jgi:hypothetical protein
VYSTFDGIRYSFYMCTNLIIFLWILHLLDHNEKKNHSCKLFPSVFYGQLISYVIISLSTKCYYFLALGFCSIINFQCFWLKILCFLFLLFFHHQYYYSNLIHTLLLTSMSSQSMNNIFIFMDHIM